MVGAGELLRDLRLLRRGGLRDRPGLDLPALIAAARIVDPVPAATSDLTVIKSLLRRAVDALGDGEAGQAAGHLFGLERGAQLVSPTDLRERAARVYGLHPETFRKEPEHQLLVQLADEILVLCHTAGKADTPEPAVESTAGADRPATVTAGRDANVALGNQIINYGTINLVQADSQPKPPPPEPVRCALPPDVPAFTGREPELRQILSVLSPDGRPDVVAIHAIDGMPGIGKTALAVHAAHLLDEARFPGGRLYLDLRAHTAGQEPLRPAEALARLLLADGVDALYLPPTLDERSALWRDRLAGRRVLLVLDNAGDSTQVAPLLPGRAGCLTLVTSRRRLGDLPGVVNVLALDVLTPGEARAMFLDLSGRVATTREVDELVGLTGHLPLAISLLARVFRQHPAWSMGDLLAETRDRLLTIRAEHASVEAAFDLSYELLPPLRQRFLRRVALHPGTDLDELAAAVLAGTTRPEAARMLEELYRDHLLVERGHRRYGLHDLIRTYLIARLALDPAPDRDQALARLLDYYVYVTEVAGEHLTRQTRPRRALPVSSGGAVALPEQTPEHTPEHTPELPDRLRALAWARAERANLVACVVLTERTDPARSLALTAALADLLRLDGPWSDAAALHAAAARRAAGTDDWFGEAQALSNLGTVRFLAGHFDEGDAALIRARDLFGEHGERLGEANAISGLADLQLMNSKYDTATGSWRQALELYRSLGDRRGEANTLTDLGKALYRVGDAEGADEAMQQALELHRALGNPEGEAFTLTNLAVVHYRAGRPAAAVPPLERAAELYRGIGDLRGEANALTYLGHALRMTGRLEEVIELLTGALELHRGLGHRLGVANTLLYIGHARDTIGDRERAEQILEEALELYRGLDHPLGQANTWLYLGVLHRDAGDLAAAAADFDRTLARYREMGDTGGEMEALNEAGALYRMQGDRGRAEAAHEEALRMARAEKSAWDEALALAGLTRGGVTSGPGLRQALGILRDIGAENSPEAQAIAAELAEIERAPRRP